MVVTRSKRSGAAASSAQPTARPAKRAKAAAPPPPTGDGPRYWLMKSEPESRMERNSAGDMIEMKFGLDDLIARPESREPWDGVRNHEAKNAMLAMGVDSNCKKVRPHIAGIVRIVREAYPDYTAWDRNDVHFDGKSSEENPRWFMVDVQFLGKFRNVVGLDDIKKRSELRDMKLLKRARISVVEVRKDEWDVVCDMAGGVSMGSMTYEGEENGDEAEETKG